MINYENYNEKVVQDLVVVIKTTADWKKTNKMKHKRTFSKFSSAVDVIKPIILRNWLSNKETCVISNKGFWLNLTYASKAKGLKVFSIE
jgi:hypothetical protein